VQGDLRKTMLEAIANRPADQLQSGVVMKEVQHRIKAYSEEDQQAVLTCWYDLIRMGVLSWGLDLANPNPPFAHLTERGRKALQNVSRDPSNPDGYLAALGASLTPHSVSWSYVTEALATYNAGCHKASAVMIGAASEALLLDLRDRLVERLDALQANAAKDLTDWRFKKVLDAVEAVCAGRRRTMPGALGERFGSYWSSFTSHLRLTRNDAGHPKSVEPVTEDAVHGSLLIFPELAKLVRDLREWMASDAFAGVQ
jgi:hypothetical protein